MKKQMPANAKSELTPTGKLRVGVNLGNFLLVNKDRATGELRGVVADIKASGLVAQAIERHGVHGVSVAP